uniref:Histidine kinase/HSP90-like ATPase domain-containing protein n=1 Tax=Amphora coffeiformis TaxID=265554 RepID=A0A7S3L0F8_9STRA|mmetsp:Transcript_377/g.799  ORF Transcript_377/g.799 Transcript_377/m.799 type:complete len:800 (+) Transcript_377:87-2486(+)
MKLNFLWKPFLLAAWLGSSLVTAEEEAAAAAASSIDEPPPSNAEHFAFQAEVSRMLDIVVNSLYQHKEVFMRELISNAADALDKYRYLALTEPEAYGDGSDTPLEVRISFDEAARTLTLRDTGVGMTHDDLVSNLGTVARSGTGKFLEALKENADAVSQIGQFGVGFYSAFLVADKVRVKSKNPTDPDVHVWESANGAGDFVVYKTDDAADFARGTEITLHLKEDALEYADAVRLSELVTRYSEFIVHPIFLQITETMQVPVEDEEEAGKSTDLDDEKSEDDLTVEDEEKEPKMKEVTTHTWERLNDNPAIWTREKESISDGEYQSFYNVLSGGDGTEAATWSHFFAEGNINFKSILYLPESVPPSIQYMDIPKGLVRLYVRKVLIGDDFNLLPRYLSFMRGVVDSDDLPLNVNRETLQESKILTIIQKKLVRKAIELIKNFSKEAEEADSGEAEVDADGNVDVEKKNKYLEWYKKFSPNLKLGCIEDEPNRAKLIKLLRFQTSKSNGELVSLSKYVENMKDWQDEIYVIGGASTEEIEKSPFLEPFAEKDLEIVYLTDTIDEYLIKAVGDFEKKKFKQVTSENVKFKDEDEDLIKRREKYYKKEFQPLTKWLRRLFQGSIVRVQVAKRSLGSMPAVVTSSDFGNSANMERIARAQAFQHGVDPSSLMSIKILEINPRHPFVKKLLAEAPAEDADASGDKDIAQSTIDAAWMIHDMAMLNGGYPINDPKAHNNRLTKVLQSQFGLDSVTLEAEVDPPVEEDEAPDVDMGMGGINMEDFDMDSIDLDAMMEQMQAQQDAQ